MPTHTEDFNRGRKAALLAFTAKALNLHPQHLLRQGVNPARLAVLSVTPKPSTRSATARWDEASEETWEVAAGILSAMLYLEP